MDRRFILFIACSVVILFGSNYFLTLRGKQAKEDVVTTSVSELTPVSSQTTQSLSQTPPAQGSPATPFEVATTKAEVFISLANTRLQLAISSLGARIKEIILTGYSNHGDNEAITAVELIGPGPKPDFFGLRAAVDGQELPMERMLWESSKNADNGATFFLKPMAGLSVKKSLVLKHDSFTGTMSIRVDNQASTPLDLDYLSMLWGPAMPEGRGRFNIKQIAVLHNGKVERFKPKKKEQQQELPLTNGWIGLRDQYFATIFFGEPGAFKSARVIQRADQALEFLLQFPVKRLAPGEGQEFSFHFYFGPQRYEILKTEGHQLQKIIDFGFFGFLAIPMLYLLKFFHAVTHNYGFAIILLTLFIRGLLWWPTHKSYSSMKKMQSAMNKMQPRLKTLKEIYKDNPSKLNEETMKLYREYQINPMGGCLPMLLQMPIFFALYATLSSTVELKGAPFIWFWQDLSTKDPYYVLPLAMGLSMFVQQKLSTPPAATPEAAAQQKMMLYLMPAMLTFFSFMWPSGLLLYWVVSNILSIGQQMIINRKA